MLTPTLAAITWLNPLGNSFIPTLETTSEFTIEWFSFKKFILDNHDKENAEVSDQEHITFLTFSLSY